MEGSTVSDILGAPVPPARLALAWINGYSAAVIRSPAATVLFDPVALPPEALAPVDLVAVTHEHADHWDPGLVRAILANSAARVATTPFLAGHLGARDGRVRGMQAGERLRAGDVELQALRCDHPARQPLSFVLRTGDGVTVYHPSDGVPSHQALEVPRTVDIDVLLYLGTSLQSGAAFAELLQPRVMVTYRIEPEAAHRRARGILTARAPHIPFKALRQHDLFLYPQDVPGPPEASPDEI